jgi:hypothetical protein
MNVDIGAAVAFLASHGRTLDRRRLGLSLGGDDVEAVLAALDAYRNGDGGYGWGIEPDLRSPESQPTGAMHAFEVLTEVAAVTSVATPRAVELCDWLDQHTLGDGGLPFTLPVTIPAGSAPLWLGTDHETASLQMTAQVAANAHLLARHDPQVAGHPWLARATSWCYDAIAQLDSAPHAYELLFAVRFLDAIAETDTGALALLDRLARLLPPDGARRGRRAPRGAPPPRFRAPGQRPRPPALHRRCPRGRAPPPRRSPAARRRLAGRLRLLVPRRRPRMARLRHRRGRDIAAARNRRMTSTRSSPIRVQKVAAKAPTSDLVR